MTVATPSAPAGRAAGDLARRVVQMQDLADTAFRDRDGLLVCIHRELRPLAAADFDGHAYNRPPYAGMGDARLWWTYEMTNVLLGQYLVAQAQRARAGDAGGLAAGRAMLGLLLSIYFDRSRALEPGHLGKPIVPPGGLASYGHAPEVNHDQLHPIWEGLADFHAFATPDEQRRIEQVIVEMADHHRRRQYRMATRGTLGLGPGHSVHGNIPMLALLLAHRFAPGAGFYDEYLRWFDMSRADPRVNATCLTNLHYLCATGQARGDQELYYQGTMNMYVDVIARLAALDPGRRDLFRTRLAEWWDEQAPLLRDDGRVTWSMMTTLATRRWRPMRPGEVERGPYSCWWGAAVLFSGQWFATIPVAVAAWWPQRRAELRAVLLRVLTQTGPDALQWCWPAEGTRDELPANIRVAPDVLLPPVWWLRAYWEARATGLLTPDD